jgi:cytochrome c-type biogenesis protein CcmH/NrfG
MLGRVLSAQEEREHAISALRTACRLLPGDHRPVVLMSKELVSRHDLLLYAYEV